MIIYLSNFIFAFLKILSDKSHFYNFGQWSRFTFYRKNQKFQLIRKDLKKKNPTIQQREFQLIYSASNEIVWVWIRELLSLFNPALNDGIDYSNNYITRMKKRKPRQFKGKQWLKLINFRGKNSTSILRLKLQ